MSDPQTTPSALTREQVIKGLVDKFLAWPLPDSVCSDLCATKQDYPHRSGTTLLAAHEATQMFEHVLVDLLGALTQQAQELHSVDEILSRRPALADCATRSEKIETAINVAKKADGLQTKLSKQEQKIERLKKMEEIAEWFLALVPRANIGTKETPSLKSYIEQLESKLAAMTTERNAAETERIEWVLRAERAESLVEEIKEVRDEYHQQWMDALESEERCKAVLQASEQEAGRLRNNVELMARDMCSMPSDLYQEWLDSDSQVHFRQWLAQRALKGA